MVIQEHHKDKATKQLGPRITGTKERKTQKKYSEQDL